jgi:hypothetical protein
LKSIYFTKGQGDRERLKKFYLCGEAIHNNREKNSGMADIDEEKTRRKAVIYSEILQRRGN